MIIKVNGLKEGADYIFYDIEDLLNAFSRKGIKVLSQKNSSNSFIFDVESTKSVVRRVLDGLNIYWNFE